jgi:hypothetical protein
MAKERPLKVAIPHLSINYTPRKRTSFTWAESLAQISSTEFWFHLRNALVDEAWFQCQAICTAKSFEAAVGRASMATLMMLNGKTSTDRNGRGIGVRGEISTGNIVPFIWEISRRHL